MEYLIICPPPSLKCLGFSWVLPRHYLCWHFNKLKQIWVNSFSAGLLSLYHRLCGNMRKPLWCWLMPVLPTYLKPHWTKCENVNHICILTQMWSGAVQLSGRLEGFVRGSLRCGYMATESVGYCRLSKWDTWLACTAHTCYLSFPLHRQGFWIPNCTPTNDKHTKNSFSKYTKNTFKNTLKYF